MKSQLQLFRNECTATERYITQSLDKLMQLPDSLFKFKKKENTIILNFNIENVGKFCPFEICFSRNMNTSFLSFHIGIGAEISCYEKIGTTYDDLLFKDLNNFFYSNVHAELYYNGKMEIVKAVYYPNLMILESLENQGFTTRTGYILPWTKHKVVILDYSPLIPSDPNCNHKD